MSQNPGFKFALRHRGDGWEWEIRPHGGAERIEGGKVASKAIAAACLVRSIVRGMTEPPRARA